MDITKDFIQEQTEKLKQKRQRLVLEIQRLKKEDPFMEESKEPTGRTTNEYGDDAVEDTEHAEYMQKIKETEDSLNQVDKALKKIEDGTYGLDEETNEPISMDRLRAYPEATTSN